jgi:uncharacterized protein (TIGR00369 family)
MSSLSELTTPVERRRDPGSDPGERSGLELLQGLLAAGPGAVGVSDLMGFELAEVSPGRAVFVTTTHPGFGNPMGTLHGGVTSTLLDSAMGCAVMSTLPPGVGYTTVDLHVTFLRSVPLSGASLVAEGRATHTGGRIATAEGRLLDDRQRVVATAVCTCAVLRPRPDEVADAPAPATSGGPQ